MRLSRDLLDGFALPAVLVRRRTRAALTRRLARLDHDADRDPGTTRQAKFEAVAARPHWTTSSPSLEWGALPVEFWQLVLGASLHTGSSLWPRWARTLDEAEVEWSRLTAERMGLEPGQRLLEIGAQPGALSRWAETEMPGLDVTLLAQDKASLPLLSAAVERLGPPRARVSESSLPDFHTSTRFDRIVLVEGLTRCTNPGPLLDRLSSWLAPGGRILIQISCHWRHSYSFEPGDENSWALPEVPDGALWPGQPLLDDLTRSLDLVGKWELSGEHYQRTARAWLRRLQSNSAELLDVLQERAVPRPKRVLRAWRNALIAMEVMYGFREGQEWCLTQFLLGDQRSRVG